MLRVENLWCIICLIPIFLQAQPCASDLFLQQRLQAHPALAAQRQALEDFTKKWIAENADRIASRTVITIPVAVHVVWKDPAENVSDEQIQSQIEALNQDYRAKNLEISSVPAIFKSAIADVELEFCLAKRTPDGQLTNGITRTHTNVANVATDFTQPQGLRTICYTDLGGEDAWDPAHYLNIWVGKFLSGYLGQADFPGMAVPEEDGVRVDPSAFGMINVNPPYNLGRTLTHEIGHYFNLNHLWGSSDANLNCENDDGIADTPRQSVTFRNQCPTHPQLFCGTASMFMNFMNYTDDACMAMFTKGQKARMQATLNGPRSSLLNALGCQEPALAATELFSDRHVKILGNPIVGQLHLQATQFIGTLDIQLVNAQGQILFTDHWNTVGDYIKPLHNFSPGIYFVILKSFYGNLYKKIVISR